MISPTLACVVAIAGCAGPAGPAGPTGPTGATGEQGTPGAAGEDGVDGLSTLVRVDELAPASCPTGGRTIHIGVDDDRDGVLDDTEIDSSLPSCDVREPLVVATAVGPGPDCSVGGIVTRVGYDDDDDGVLDETEVTQENTACETARPAVLAVQPDFDDFACKLGRFDVGGASAAWTSTTSGFRCDAAPAPWGSVLVAQGSGVQELDATTGEVVGTFAATGTLLVDAERLRLYVNNGADLSAFDLLTGAEVGVVDLGVDHQALSMALGDDGGRLIVATFDGSATHLHDVNPATLSRTGSQQLPSEFISVMLFVGPTLTIWDDNADVFHVYSGAPLVEDVARRVTFTRDAGASLTVTMVKDPDEAVVYIARTFDPQLVRLQLDLLPATSTFVLPNVARTLLMAEDGSRITAHTDAGFVEILVPSGIVQQSPLRAGALPFGIPFAMHHVQVAR